MLKLTLLLSTFTAMKNNKNTHIAIVAANFYPDITKRLIDGALAVLNEAGVARQNTIVQLVPGCFEIPLACRRFAQDKTCDAVVALGCAVKGDTDHYLAIMNAATQGITQVMLSYGKPIGFGIIFAHNFKQAITRCGVKKNYGRVAALAALSMISPYAE